MNKTGVIVFTIFLFTTFIHGQSPGNVSTDLVQWLKADAGTNTTTDGIGVTSWNDQANSNDAMGTGNAVYSTTNAMNGNPVIFFADDAKSFTASITRTNGTASTVFVVQEKASVSDEAWLEYRNGTRRQFFIDQRYASNNNFTITTGEPTIIVASDPGGNTSAEIIENGNSLGTSVKSFSTSWTSATQTIGDDDTGGNELDGSIAEIILYDSQLSASDRNKVESYLAIKYGIVLSNSGGGTAGDYVNSAGTIIWDASANSTYHNEVIGIGRDDNSALDQQSSSESIVTIDKGGSFSTDLGFLMTGNDAGSLAATSSGIPSGVLNMTQRIWTVDTSGSPGQISVSFQLGGGNINNTGNPSDYALIIDSDTNFSDASLHITGASIVSNVLTFTNVSFSDGDFFTLGFSGITSAPGGVTSNVTHWFRADNGTSTTTDGVAITQWDNATEVNNATQAGISNFATYQSDIHNHNPSVYFTDGDNGYFDVDLSHIKSSDYTIIAVTERDNTNSDNHFLGTTSTTANQGLHIGYETDTNITLDQFSNGVDATVSGYSAATSTASLFEAVYNSSSGKSISILENGSETSNSDSNTTGLSGLASGVLGQGNSSTSGFEGYISEIVIYDSTLSSTDLIKVESYFAIKYGMTLDNTGGGTNGDYQDTSGNIIWDASANSTYHNDLIGIGRDDNSNLDQQQATEVLETTSLSINKGGSFSNNQDFIIIGNDDGALSLTSTNINPSFIQMVTRTWKAEVSGTPGAISISFTLGGSITNTGNANDYAILIDNDTDFTNSTSHNRGATLNGSVISFTGLSLSDGDVFTLGIGSTITAPGFVLGDLLLWLKADNGTNTTTDATGITSWDDSSDNAFNATGTGAAVYDEDAINFNPAIDFTADAQPISGSISRTTAGASTVFVVQQKSSVGGQSFVEFGTSTERQYFFDNRYIASPTYSVNTNSASLLAALDTGTAVSDQADIYENGVLIGTTTNKAFSNNWTSGGTYYVGDDETGGNELTGDISEIILYNSLLSTTDQMKVESYLAIKYGITMDNSEGGTDGDYVDSTNSVIWDASANSLYHNDIAGIGRDDSSGLNQKQSRSGNSDDIVTISIDTSIAATNAANSGSFSDDRDFLIWGNNGTLTEVKELCKTRLDRDWKVQNTGSVGSVTVQFDFTSLTGLSVSDYDLQVDEDGDADYTTGTQTTYIGSVNGSNLTFTGVALSDGDVFNLVAKSFTPDITYNGSWSGGSGAGGEFGNDATDLAKTVLISSDVTLSGTHNCACLEISNNAKVTVQDNNTLTVADAVQSNGSIFLYGTAELIQTKDGVDLNNGDVQVYKIVDEATSSIYDYNYFSSPVNTSGTYSISGNLKFNTNVLDIETNTNPSFTGDKDSSTNTISTRWTYTFPDGSAWNRINGSSAIDPGLGFIMKGTGDVNRYNFIGETNNGSISTTITGGNIVLLGNPYPSSIDIDEFNTAMLSSSITTGTVYLWDQPTGGSSHNTSDLDGGYATRAGGVGTPASGITGATTPGTTIKPAQGFFVVGGSGGTITFDNTLREGATNTHFFKAKSDDMSIIRVGFGFDIENNEIYHRQLALSLRNGHSLGKDIGYDAMMLDYKSNDMYWLLDGEGDQRYVINSVSNFVQNNRMPLGVNVDEEREVTFTLDKLENYSSSVYLYDEVTKDYIDLTQNDYAVILSSGTYNDRFSIAFKEDDTLSNDNIILEDFNIRQFKEVFVVESKLKDIDGVDLLGISGELLRKKSVNKGEGNKVIVNKKDIPTGIYILKVTTKRGVITQKFFID